MILVALQIIVSFQDVLGNCGLCCVDCIFLCHLSSFYVHALSFPCMRGSRNFRQAGGGGGGGGSRSV